MGIEGKGMLSVICEHNEDKVYMFVGLTAINKLNPPMGFRVDSSPRLSDLLFVILNHVSRG